MHDAWHAHHGHHALTRYKLLLCAAAEVGRDLGGVLKE